MKLQLLLLCLCATGVSAQQSRLSAADSLAFQRVIDSARTLGLPADPLLSLVQHGRQRGMAATRILPELRNLVGALDRAKRALGSRATASEIDAGAALLQSGADVATITALRTAKPTGDITVPLVVLTDLVVRGVPVSGAEDAVVTLTRAGATDAALNEFRVGVQRDLDAGQRAESSLLRRTRETVSRFKPGGPHVPPGAHLEHMTIYTASQDPLPYTASRALASKALERSSAAIELRASAVPLQSVPGLQIRASADASTNAASGPGHAGAEAVAAFGSSRTSFGAAAGAGASIASDGFFRAPIGYGAAWVGWRNGTLRLEGRTARLGRGVAAPFTDGSPLTSSLQRASAVGDTGGTSPPPPPPQTQIPDSSRVVPTDSTARSISDFRLEVIQRVGRFSLEASTGLRILGHTPLDSWSALNVATWMTPAVAIVGGLSTRQAVHGPEVPGAMNAILGVRWSPGESNPRRSGATAPDASRAEGVVRRSGSIVELMLKVGKARLVEVCGDFTEWLPVEMVRADATHWRIELPRDRALVRLRVRIDGGPWMVPAGVARTRDAFGDELGTIVIGASVSQ